MTTALVGVQEDEHAFGERPVLKLMYAAVIRAADRWRGLTIGEFEQRRLKAIREELNRAHAERTKPAVRAAGVHRPSDDPARIELDPVVRRSAALPPRASAVRLPN